MNRMLFSVFFLMGISFMVSAQSTHTPKSTKTTAPGKAVKAHKTSVNTKSGKADSMPLSNRENYDWSDGQQATPTGKQATPSNGTGYAALKKDTIKLVKKGKKKQ